MYRIFDYTGSLSSNSLTIGSLPAGFTASIDTSIGGHVNLDVASVPEPATPGGRSMAWRYWPPVGCAAVGRNAALVKPD